METANDSPKPVADAPLSPTVRALGLVSLLTDASSEMVYPVNPVFLTKVLGAPPWVVGMVEGVAESTASLLKLYSGYLSDRLGQRKPLTLIGYGIATLSKPLIGLSAAWPQVFFARFLDRTGKGLRSSPRDALIVENSLPQQRGRAFGLHRSMDTTGAVLGPLLGYLYLRAFPEHLRYLYFLAFLPGLLAVIVLALFVKEARPAPGERKTPPRFTLKGLDPAYRRYLLVVFLFGMGNSSDSFLLLRAGEQGLATDHLLLLYALFNVVEAALGYFAGRWSDRIGRRPVIALGYAVFALVYLGFAWLPSPHLVWFLFPVYGLYYTLTQGAQKALAADLTNPDRRGTEIGIFHLLVGITAFPASLIAGWLYAAVSPAAPFFIGAVTALLSAGLLLTDLSARATPTDIR
ncbi:MAG: MFS transporter [Capsulimonadales bacterium]|nr:MFS transporter [Capsulimonadales bacterium]